MNTILCIGAHPDDMEYTCTGTLTKLKKQAADSRIYYVIVTNGENGYKLGRKTTVQQRVRMRKQEQLEVARKLGIEKVFFLGYRDGFLQYTEKLRGQLVKIIKTLKPEIIFTFDPANKSFTHLNTLHRDHRIVGEVVFDACFAAKNMWMYPGEPHRIQKFYFFTTDKPNHIEDITEVMDFKLELLSCHRSQFPDFTKVAEHVRTDLSKHSDQFTYSEAFRIVEVPQPM
jgi:N,N'-diacetylchitobiose non-reducing end deacetylase